MASNILRVAQTLRLGTAELALIGQASVWVEDSIADRSSIGFTQWIIQQALAASAPGQLELIVFDEALTGLSAPFEAVNSGGEKLMRVTHDQQEFKATLAYLRDHVQGVNNVMQGRADTLVEFRRAVNYPVEGYKLVVVSADVSALGEQLQDHLSVLLKAGPRAGISFLIHSMTLGANPFMVSMCDKYTVKHGEIRDDTGQALAVGWRPPGADQFIGTATAVARALASAELDSIAFDAVQALDKPWQASSADGVTCAIGRYGVSTVEITLGDELNQRHNMLVTGAVGQGKSNLISVIIHSLCQRYSPAELEFYLLDFKEGVTLQAFFDQRTGEYLPHARVLGLEADREFGLSVFRHLFGIYKERMRLFKAAGVQSIKKYREANPGAAMPRLILVIDEFQMMFAERDRVSDEIADLLVKGVRLFRACGIHVILASQTIGGNMSLMGSAGEGLFGQVPIRVALKNSLAESHATLGAKNEGAAHLRAREAIVNLDYGEVSANRKTSIAFADEAVLAPLRRGWWQAARERTDPPYVFVGERKHALVDDAAELRAAAASPAPVAFLGSRIEVGARPLALPLSRDLGRNIAFLGPGDAISEIASVAVSLAANRAGPAARFVVLDLAGADPAWQSAKAGLAAALAGLGCQVAFAGKAEVPEQVRELAALAGAGGGPEPVYVIGLGLDRCRDLPTDFQDLCRAGPPAGMHLLGSWLKLDSFQDQVGYGGAAYFDVKVAFRLDTQSARQFMNDPLLEWRPVENRMLVWDSAEMAEPIRAIPYAAFEPDRIAQALAEA